MGLIFGKSGPQTERSIVETAVRILYTPTSLWQAVKPERLYLFRCEALFVAAFVIKLVKKVHRTSQGFVIC